MEVSAEDDMKAAEREFCQLAVVKHQEKYSTALYKSEVLLLVLLDFRQSLY